MLKITRMRLGFPFHGKLRVLAALLLLPAAHRRADADTYLSNLGNRFEVPGSPGSIGDIHGLFRGGNPYGTDAVDFATGDGSFDVNTVTLEFSYYRNYPAGDSAPQWIDIQLFQGTGTTDLLLGRFGNPVDNPMPTQWPDSRNAFYTRFVDFSPLQAIRLKPFSQYSLVLSMPVESPGNAALLFSVSSDYVAPSGWTMSATRSGTPSAAGEYLKIAIDATIIPEPNAATLLVTGFIVLVVFASVARLRQRMGNCSRQRA